jgi:hypothetical protein
MVPVVNCLPSKHTVLSSKPSTAKKIHQEIPEGNVESMATILSITIPHAGGEAEGSIQFSREWCQSVTCEVPC